LLHGAYDNAALAAQRFRTYISTMHKWIAVVAMLCTVVLHADEKQLSIEDGGQLTLTDRAPNKLSGRFERAGRVAQFSSSVSDENRTFELRDATNRSLLRIATTANDVTVDVFGDGIVLHGTRGSGEKFTPTFEVNGGASEEVLTTLIANPAYAVMPNLAIELVHLGITGDRYPAAQVIHGVAVASANAQQLAMPDLGDPSDRQAIKPAALPPCRDLRGDKGTICYGMCGNSCHCWWPICGSCCGCDGCETHDYACRITGCPVSLSPQQRLAYHTGCLTFGAFFAARSPCHRYPGTHPPPCPQTPGN
jgi:hypothetical protein